MTTIRNDGLFTTLRDQNGSISQKVGDKDGTTVAIGPVTLDEGAGIVLTPDTATNTVTIASTGGGGSGLTSGIADYVGTQAGDKFVRSGTEAIRALAVFSRNPRSSIGVSDGVDIETTSNEPGITLVAGNTYLLEFDISIEGSVADSDYSVVIVSNPAVTASGQPMTPVSGKTFVTTVANGDKTTVSMSILHTAVDNSKVNISVVDSGAGTILLGGSNCNVRVTQYV